MDLQDAAGIKSACEGIDYILHQGALASVPRSVKDPLTSHESNINGTLNLLIAARDAKLRRIVYAASSSAYGDQPTQPKQQAMLPRPLSPYAVQKLTCEYYIRSFYRAYGLEGEGDIKHSLADISRASKELGYQPKAHFHEGLKKPVAWYVEEKEKSHAPTLKS